MNDQMYKQNRRVMSAAAAEGGGAVPPPDKLRQKSSRRDRSSCGSGGSGELQRPSVSIASASLDKSREEPLMKKLSRRFFEFMFSQVGVGSLFVGYTICGAFIFQVIETTADEKNDYLLDMSERRNEAIKQLWNITSKYNLLNKRLWDKQIEVTMTGFQHDTVMLVKRGYDGSSVEDRWTFPNALMFTLSLITTIGYGDTVPVSEYGKIVTMIYAILGIPVYILYFRNIGKVFANIFKWIYRNIHRWIDERRKKNKEVSTNVALEYFNEDTEEVLVPTTACIFVSVLYVLIGMMIFTQSEGWSYLDSSYFCITSLLKIGFGDFVPGSSKAGEINMQLYVDYCYLLLGMAVVAMNYYLLREEVLFKTKKVKMKFRKFCDKIKYKQGTEK